MPSATAPDWTLHVDGSPYDHVAGNLRVTRWTPYDLDGTTELEWFVPGGALMEPGDDPFGGKPIALYADSGSGDELVFAGRCEVGPRIVYSPRYGWTRYYQALGLRSQGDHVPITDPVTGGDTIAVNLDPSDPDYRAALAGRTVGQILRYVLEGTENAEALDGLGIGDYVTLPTSPATAHATESGGVVSVVIDDGGAGYGTGGNLPRVVLVGGDGSYTSATAAVSGGAVTGVTVSGSSGYTVVPEVWISPLPLDTLTDLALMTVKPPHPVWIQGEKLLTALDGALRSIAPNHRLHVEPDGTLRFLDIREFTPFTLTMGSDLVDVGGIQLNRSVRECYPRVVVRGGPDAAGVLLSTRQGTLEEDFGHNGLTSEEAKDYWNLREYSQPSDYSGRATATAALDGDELDNITVNNGGWGYTSTPTVTIEGDGSGATATATISSGHVTSISVGSPGSGYTEATVLISAPPNPNRDDGTCTCPDSSTITVESSDANKTWAANIWDHSSTGRKAWIYLYDSVNTGIDSIYSARIVSHDALSAGGTADVTIDGTLPSTDFDNYEIVGTAGGVANVWRKYKPTDATIAANLLNRFPQPRAYRFSNDQAASQTCFPTAAVLKSSSGDPPFGETPWGVLVDPDDGSFLMDRPVVLAYGTTQNLLLGGDSTDGIPDDVRIFCPVRRGQLQAVMPPDDGGPDYEGTSHTIEGLERTLTLTVPSWIDGSNQTNMEEYAQDVLDSVKDAAIEGVVPMIGMDVAWFAPGQAITLDAAYDTPWADVDLPIMGVELTFAMSGPTIYQTTFRVSNRRAAYGVEQFARRPVTGVMLGTGDDVFNPMTGEGVKAVGDFAAAGRVHQVDPIGGTVSFLAAAGANTMNFLDANTPDAPRNTSIPINPPSGKAWNPYTGGEPNMGGGARRDRDGDGKADRRPTLVPSGGGSLLRRPETVGPPTPREAERLREREAVARRNTEGDARRVDKEAERARRMAGSRAATERRETAKLERLATGALQPTDDAKTARMAERDRALYSPKSADEAKAKRLVTRDEAIRAETAKEAARVAKRDPAKAREMVERAPTPPTEKAGEAEFRRQQARRGASSMRPSPTGPKEPDWVPPTDEETAGGGGGG